MGAAACARSTVFTSSSIHTSMAQLATTALGLSSKPKQCSVMKRKPGRPPRPLTADEVNRGAENAFDIARRLPGNRVQNRKTLIAFFAWLSAELIAGRDVPLYGVGKLVLIWRKRAGRSGWRVKLQPSKTLTDRVKDSLGTTTPQLKHLTSTARAYLNGSPPVWKHDASKYKANAAPADGSGGGEGVQPDAGAVDGAVPV